MTARPGEFPGSFQCHLHSRPTKSGNHLKSFVAAKNAHIRSYVPTFNGRRFAAPLLRPHRSKITQIGVAARPFRNEPLTEGPDYVAAKRRFSAENGLETESTRHSPGGYIVTEPMTPDEVYRRIGVPPHCIPTYLALTEAGKYAQTTNRPKATLDRKSVV